jgi:hypothetical protein
MSNNLKPIETRYKGYRFRSRLEARWAVFFDHMGTKWEYEKEGYHLSNGEMYLPDFWLPDLGIWIEIKGQEPTKAELERCRLLREATGNAVAIFPGLPGECHGVLWCCDLAESSGGESVWYDVGISHTPEGDLAFRFPGCDDSSRTFFVDQNWDRYLPIPDSRRERTRACPKVERALDAAKAARFEHGETAA